MNNLFSNLYHWLHGQDENFVTEAFAFIVRRLLEADDQIKNITEFIKGSFEKATGCITNT